jgi:hypothetical protein
MAGYTPLFSSLTTGTLYGRWPDIGLWPIVLSLADKNGVVDVTAEYLSGVTGLQVEAVISCMARFCEPDPRSRSKEESGARLVLVDPERDWGWRIVNHLKYREKARLMGKAEQERDSGKNAERMKDRRRPPKTAADPPSYSDADSYADKDKKPPSEALVAQDRDDPALTVFVHWQQTWKHPSTKLDRKRRKRIEARLKDFTADQLRDAISGFTHSPWHNGTDPKGQGTVYDSIDTLLRDNAQVEKGMALFAHPPRPPPKPETAHDRMKRLLNGNDDSRVIEHDPEFPAIPGH